MRWMERLGSYRTPGNRGKLALLGRRRLRLGIPAALAMMVMVMVTLVAQFIAIPPQVGHAASYRTDVILLHGFDFGGSGVNCTNNWSDVVNYFSASGDWASSGHSWINNYGSIVALNYYVNDTTCSLPGILQTDTLYHYTEAGTYGAEGGCRGVGPQQNLDLYEGTRSESIQRLGCKLAWYVYNNYTKVGLPVVILAHSMGGLIARWALGFTQSDPTLYPGPLWVPAVVTMGTPHQGVSASLLSTLESVFCNCLEVNDMGANSSDPSNTITLLKPIQSPSGDWHRTAWMTMAMSSNLPDLCLPVGSPTCTYYPEDCRPANVDTSVGTLLWPDPIGQTMSGSYRIEYTDPCYSHGAYLYDRPWPYQYNVPGYPTTKPNSDDLDASANYCAPSCSMSDTLTTATGTFPKPLRAAYGFLSAHVPVTPTTTSKIAMQAGTGNTFTYVAIGSTLYKYLRTSTGANMLTFEGNQSYSSPITAVAVNGQYLFVALGDQRVIKTTLCGTGGNMCALSDTVGSGSLSGYSYWQGFQDFGEPVTGLAATTSYLFTNLAGGGVARTVKTTLCGTGGNMCALSDTIGSGSLSGYSYWQGFQDWSWNPTAIAANDSLVLTTIGSTRVCKTTLGSTGGDVFALSSGSCTGSYSGYNYWKGYQDWSQTITNLAVDSSHIWWGLGSQSRLVQTTWCGTGGNMCALSDGVGSGSLSGYSYWVGRQDWCSGYNQMGVAGNGQYTDSLLDTGSVIRVVAASGGSGGNMFATSDCTGTGSLAGYTHWVGYQDFPMS